MGKEKEIDNEDTGVEEEEEDLLQEKQGDDVEESGGDEGNEDDDDDDEEEDDEEEEDPEDLYETSREKCAASKHCSDLMAVFEECESRVNSKTHTEENCSQEILDFFHCQDTCAAKGLFAKLK